MNLAACATLPRSPLTGTWFRLVQPAYMAAALSSAHTKLAPSRFNAGTLLPPSDRYASLYFAENTLVAEFEIGAILGNPLPGGHISHPRLSFVSLNVLVSLQDTVDLTDPTAAHGPLMTNVQELTGDWQGYGIRSATTTVPSPTGEAPTQALGRSLYTIGTEGFRAVSAKVPWHETLIVFPDNMRPGSSLRFVDRRTGATVHEVRP